MGHRESTSSAAGRPAKTSRSRARARGSTESNPGSGGSSPASCGSSSPGSSSGRTLQLPLLELCLPFSAPLPPSGSMRSGVPTARPTLERRTSGAACSSSQSTENWSTPTAYDGRSNGSKPRERQGGEGLRVQVERWPTATSSDQNGSGSQGYGKMSASTQRPRSEGTTLTDAMALHHGLRPREIRTGGPDGLVLNPEFVEALMGFPEGWTHVDDGPASVALGTRSSPPKRRRPSEP